MHPSGMMGCLHQTHGIIASCLLGKINGMQNLIS